jgi:L-ascorbate metabolism protein UlaG (beta-lactamase superfamily)
MLARVRSAVLVGLAVSLLVVAARPVHADPPARTTLTWYGHAAFAIHTPAGKTILIDPWIDNPANPRGKADLAALTSIDLILVSHGHADHVGNAVALGKRTKAKLVATFDLGRQRRRHP